MDFPAPTAPFVVALLMGTIKKPKLTNITTGMFTGRSLIFHTQEGETYAEHNGEMKPVGVYHEYVRNVTNKTSVNLRCSFRGAPRFCKATLTLEPKDLRIIETEKVEGKRDKHFLKSKDPWTKLMLDPEFWKVKERKDAFASTNYSFASFNKKLLKRI